jgi:hypothetical protein
MLSVSIMAVPSAAGHGTSDGTKKTQSGTNRKIKNEIFYSSFISCRCIIHGICHIHAD